MHYSKHGPVSVDGDVGGATNVSFNCRATSRCWRLEFCCCSRVLFLSSSLLFSFSIYR